MNVARSWVEIDVKIWPLFDRLGEHCSVTEFGAIVCEVSDTDDIDHVALLVPQGLSVDKITAEHVCSEARVDTVSRNNRIKGLRQHSSIPNFESHLSRVLPLLFVFDGAHYVH